MPDCSLCARPLGHARRRCKQCGACEDCCHCYDEDDVPVIFSPAELGLDPEDDDRFYEVHGEQPWRGRRRRRDA